MSFNTIKFINNVVNELDQKHYDRDFKMLDRLCKKIDVVKKVYTTYADDLSKATSIEVVPLDSYIKLLKVLIFYAKNDLKYLNSGLKLYDKIKNKIDIDDQQEIEKNIELIFKGMLCGA